MGKLKEIRKDFAEIKSNVNIMKEKVIELESFKESFQDLATKFNAIYDNYFLPDPDVTPEQIKQQEEEFANNMKLIVRGAISDMLADPENQKNIQAFAQNLTGAMSGKGQGGWADLMTENGEINWGIAIQQFMNRGNKGSPVVQNTTRGGKTTGY